MKKHKYVVTKYHLYKLIDGNYHGMFYEVDKLVYLKLTGVDKLIIKKFGSDNIMDIYDYFHKTPWCSDLLIRYDQVLDYEIKIYKSDIINRVINE